MRHEVAGRKSASASRGTRRTAVRLAQRYESALLALSRTNFCDLSSALREITEVDARTLKVERVSFWTLEEDGSALVLQALYVRSSGLHTDHHPRGDRILAEDCPEYFRALEECRAIPADDACRDPRTGVFRESYLEPLGITSKLDVPVRVFGQSVGVLCHSHCGKPRHWQRGEEEFATAIAALASLAIEQDRLRRAEAGRRESEDRFRALAQHVPGVIYLCRNDERYTNLYLNDAVLELTGYPKEEFLAGRVNCTDLYHPDDAAGIFEVVNRALASRRPFSFVYRLRHRSGEYRWVEEHGSGVFAGGELRYLTGFISDITERKLTEEKLQRSAFYDPLTGLPNRALFLDRLGRTITRGQHEAGLSFAVLFLDLDRFKVVNDSLGHDLGDDLLRAFGERLLRCVDETETVARLGGDEFVLLLENADVVDACHVAERIRGGASQPFRLAAREIFSSASIGIVVAVGGYERPEEVLRDAEIAMYRAKAQGRARHEVFDPAMHACAVELLRLETDLRRALERGEFTVFYQPILELRTGRVVACEALLRWRHPEHGLLEPERFLGVAEETGLILPMGDWVLDEVLRALAAWQRSGEHWSATINLSARQLAQEDLPESLVARLRAHGLPPSRLGVEVTEYGVVEDLSAAEATLRRLRELGIRIYLDDFGTGYSSLAYLQRLPIDALKIDRTFIQQLGEPGEGPLVAAILGLARSLGLKCVAEGVETQAQLCRLRALDFDYAQGRLLAPPMSPSELKALRLAS